MNRAVRSAPSGRCVVTSPRLPPCRPLHPRCHPHSPPPSSHHPAPHRSRRELSTQNVSHTGAEAVTGISSQRSHRVLVVSLCNSSGRRASERVAPPRPRRKWRSQELNPGQLDSRVSALTTALRARPMHTPLFATLRYAGPLGSSRHVASCESSITALTTPSYSAPQDLRTC